MSNGLGVDLSILQNPLSPADIASLKDTIVQAGVTRKALDDAEAAGIDVSAARKQLDDSEAQAKRLLEVYDK